MAEKYSEDRLAYKRAQIKAQNPNATDDELDVLVGDWIDEQEAQGGGYGTKYSPNYEQRSVTEPQESWSDSSQSGRTSSNVQGTQSSTSYNDIPGVRRNEDGSVNTADLQAKKDADAAKMRSAFLADAIGANRDKIRSQREKEIAENNRRAKVAAWTDSARLISDIISAGAGGNVYSREKDTTAKEMNERNKQLRELQAAEDAQNALQDYQRNKELAMAIMQNDQRLDQLAAVQHNVANNNSNTTGTSSSSSRSHTRNNGSRSTSGYVSVGYGDDFASIYGPDGSFGTISEKAGRSGLKFDFEKLTPGVYNPKLFAGNGNQTIGGFNTTFGNVNNKGGLFWGERK